MFKIAMVFNKGFLKGCDWWPSLVKREEGDTIKSWPMMPFSYHVKKILKAAGILPEENWKAKALVFLQEYCYDYKNRKKYIQAMALLIASDNDTLTEIEKYLEDIHKYKFGECDPDD